MRDKSEHIYSKGDIMHFRCRPAFACLAGTNIFGVPVHVCLHLSGLVDMMSRWKEKGTVGLYGIVAGWLLVTGSCSVFSAPVIPGNLGHFQPVRI